MPPSLAWQRASEVIHAYFRREPVATVLAVGLTGLGLFQALVSFDSSVLVVALAIVLATVLAFRAGKQRARHRSPWLSMGAAAALILLALGRLLAS